MDETPLRQPLGLDHAPLSTGQPTRPPRWKGISTAESNAPRTLPIIRGAVKEIIETLIFILLIFLVVRGIVQNFKIVGASMEPNFHSEQFILVNKLVYFHFDMNAPLRLLPGQESLPAKVVYPFRMPQRGDVVVFEYPRDLSQDYIKRVIALPGETIQIKDGQVYINGEILYESYLQGAQTNCRAEDPCAEGRPIVVRPGTVFVMGDNRGNSSDSREWEELPLDRIIGQAWVTYWPPEQWGSVRTPTYDIRSGSH